MRTLATKQPIKEDSPKQDRTQSPLSVNGLRSNTISPLSTGIPLLQRQCACGGGCPRCQDNPTLQPNLKISEPGDVYEQEADSPRSSLRERVADAVMRLPEPSAQRQVGTEEEEMMVQREAIAHSTIPPTQGQDRSEDPPMVDEVMRSSGQPLDSDTRMLMESRFGQDFSQVQIHTDATAAASAQVLNAVAYTLGQDIVFGAGSYQPQTPSGKRLLAHELTHTLQQKHTPALARTLQRVSLDQFQQDLAAISTDHATVVNELFVHPRFTTLADFLRRCPTGTIDFAVTRLQERVRGQMVDLFGGFSPSFGGNPATLMVNPQRPEHAKNPIELVDTVVHETLHAIQDLRASCENQTNPFPLAANIKDAFHDRELQPLFAATPNEDTLDRSVVARLSAAGTTTTSGTNLLEYFDLNYGPSASRPETHYIDLNRQGLELVTAIMADIRRAHPTIGQETVSFDNLELLQSASLLPNRSWLNARQRSYSMSLHKNRVAAKRKIDPATFTDREYDISAIQVVEFADSRVFDPNTASGWGPVGGVWGCEKRSRFTNKLLHTYVTGVRSNTPGGGISYQIIQHT